MLQWEEGEEKLNFDIEHSFKEIQGNGKILSKIYYIFQKGFNFFESFDDQIQIFGVGDRGGGG